ncbi:DUF1993 domain-containing protein [Aurantiacibacter poecillastricola]|uniref:DUF1993 domain-containing protein n=1 Tax=Aurantiacibacter poecillastricola TaxID=3064385 RepID=UPI00273E2E8D|nr:DUF1993 domain-containing protein [Aurantiacibacter sp. 219JJ12-13]MDP5263003.1 DUF1993 domain-containing protein [Aurantiacibacter sp. 219JJ12-13]
MPFSLYEATIPTMIQMLNAGQSWIEKAKACDIPDEDIAAARLADDMLPFAYQVKSMVNHSVGAIEGVRKGSFSPHMDEPETDLEKMRLNLGAAENTLRALSMGEIESFIGQEMHFLFEQKGVNIPFTAENFLLSFSQPNFFFHATTTYALLRKLGLNLGKIDYLGQMRTARG